MPFGPRRSLGHHLQHQDFDFGQFDKMVDDFPKKVERKAVEMTKRIVRRLQKKVVEMTPVDTGRAAGNWHISVGRVSEKYDDPPESGWSLSEIRERTIDKGRAMLKSYDRPTQTITLVNNVPYINILEYGSMHHEARAMLARALAELKSEMADAGWADRTDE